MDDFSNSAAVQESEVLPLIIGEGSARYRQLLHLSSIKSCDCKPNHLNCMTAKEWIKSQIGVWQFNYEGRDIRKKELHPATFPLSLASRIIRLFTHEGELVLDPFAGSGTTLIAAQDGNRNAVGFDLKEAYARLCEDRLMKNRNLLNRVQASHQVVVQDDARLVDQYVAPESVSLVWTSPPYANMLNRRRQNKSRRGDTRDNGQLGKIEQYSQDERDLGTMALIEYTQAMGDIFARLLPLMKPKSHCVINVPDMWWENERVTLHIALVEELRRRGFELRNTIIWDRTNIVNNIGIFGWPSNYITMGTTFEYLLDFWKPPVEMRR